MELPEHDLTTAQGEKIHKELQKTIDIEVQCYSYLAEQFKGLVIEAGVRGLEM